MDMIDMFVSLPIDRADIRTLEQKLGYLKEYAMTRDVVAYCWIERRLFAVDYRSDIPMLIRMFDRPHDRMRLISHIMK